MDSVGLLAAWVGILSFLIAVLIAAAVTLLGPLLGRTWRRAVRASVPERSGGQAIEGSGSGYLAELVSLYAQMILNLVAAVGLMIVSLVILDLGPSLLAATLPFDVNGKLLTRVTGLFLLAAMYWFVLRLAWLAVRIRRQNRLRKPFHAAVKIHEEARSVGRRQAV